MELPKFYKTLYFTKESLLKKMYGDKPTDKQKKEFETYWASNKRWEDLDAFEAEEYKKSIEAELARRAAHLKNMPLRTMTLKWKDDEYDTKLALNLALYGPKTKSTNKPTNKPASKPTNKSANKSANEPKDLPKDQPVTNYEKNQDWHNHMLNLGFQKLINDDGTTTYYDNNKLIAYYNNGRANPINGGSMYNYKWWDLKSEILPTFSIDDKKYWEPDGDEEFINGTYYPIYKHVLQDRLYAYDPWTNKVIPLWEDVLGNPKGIRKNASWLSLDKVVNLDHLKELGDEWRIIPTISVDDTFRVEDTDGYHGIYLKVNKFTSENSTDTYFYDPITKKVIKAKPTMFDYNIIGNWVDPKSIPSVKKINKHQQGGIMNENIQQQIIQLVQAAMQGNQEATQQINQIMAAADKGDQKAIQLALMIEAVAKQMQGNSIKAALGAKLNYVQKLKNMCPEGTEKIYLKNGGCMCKQKSQTGGSLPKEEAHKKKNQLLKTPIIKSNACGGKTKKKK